METNNDNMRERVNTLMQDKGSAANQKTAQEEISSLITENQGNQNMIKEKLNYMTEDMNESKKMFPNEPETRVKK